MNPRWVRAILGVPLAVAATLLAADDGRTGWTVFVGVMMFALLAASVWLTPGDAGFEAKEDAKHQARVDKILERYERQRGRH